MGGIAMNLNAQLTKRETEIAEHIAWGAQKKEIAESLYISPHTVNQTTKNIYEKAGVTSVGQLCAWWFCKTYNIEPIKKIALSLFFMALIGANEFNTTDDHAIKTGRVKVRSGKVRRRGEHDNDSPFQLEA